jgi:hypothetical protein
MKSTISGELVPAFDVDVIDSRVCRLAEMMHNLMEISVASSIPAYEGVQTR